MPTFLRIPMALHYPLELRFKLLAIASQIEVRDATGTLLLYVRQKVFRLREAVSVFRDRGQQELLYRIDADRVIDWSARYAITHPGGQLLGVVQRRGMRSLWRARYDIADAAGTPAFTVQEGSPLVRVADGLVGDIPILGMLAGYVFNPTYLVTRADGGDAVVRVTKRPALFEGRFRLEQLQPIDATTGELILLAVLMMLLLERTRG